jgi:hypothetical protein
VKVQIEGNLFIKSDRHQFIIEECTTRKDGKGEGKPTVHGYFANLNSAVKHLVKMKVKQSTAKTLLELTEDVKRIEQSIHTKLSI